MARISKPVGITVGHLELVPRLKRASSRKPGIVDVAVHGNVAVVKAVERKRVKGRWCYLYRAIDSTGATIDFLLSALRDAAAAKRLFRKALSDPSHPQPRVINTDEARIYSSAIPALQQEGTLRRRCRHRPVQYLNNVLEQDHRAIKRRVKAKQGFREFRAARRTIQGYEAMHMIRKGQARWVSGNHVLRQIQFIRQVFELAA